MNLYKEEMIGLTYLLVIMNKWIKCIYKNKFLRDKELNISVAWEGWEEPCMSIWDKETTNLKSITILSINHTKNSLNNLVILKTRMKEVIRFIKNAEVVNQTIIKVRESAVHDNTIDDYKYSIQFSF